MDLHKSTFPIFFGVAKVAGAVAMCDRHFQARAPWRHAQLGGAAAEEG